MPLSKLRNKPKPKADSLPYSFTFEAIGTGWRITIEQPLNETAQAELLTAIASRIEEFDHHYSRFREDSLVTSMAKRAGKYRLPADAEPLFDLYHRLYDLSGGLMTPLIGRLMDDAGYGSAYSLQPKRLGPTPEWSEALDYMFPDLLVKQPALLDLGAAGKGYLVDIVAGLLEDAGIVRFSINAGGDILNRGVSEALARVGLEHPTRPDQVIGIARLHDQSLCGSAGNRRVWEDFNHIINPKTKASPDHLLATWVVAGTALLADGLATALFFADVPKLSQAFDFEYALVRKDLSLEHSPNFPAEFFTASQASLR
jgi:thiamine biosynthesis lipoprotein